MAWTKLAKTYGLKEMKRICVAALLLSLCSIGIGQENPAPGQGFIDAPGGPVWYKVVGSGPGIPLLALHGGPGGTSCGFSLLEPLGDQRPIVRYDQLGTGRSGRPDDMSLWTVDHFVEELHVVRQELGLGQVDHCMLVGLAAVEQKKIGCFRQFGLDTLAIDFEWVAGGRVIH